MSASDPQVFTATLEPYAQAQLSFKSGGPVDWIQHAGAGSGEHVLSPGDSVRRGQPLAHVRLLDYEQKLAQARTSVLSAEALRRSAEAVQRQAAQDHARAQALYSNDALTKPDMDRSQANFDTANSSVSQAEAGFASARSQVAQSLTALGDARLLAPFDGTVASRTVELGTLVAPGQPAFTFLDTSRVKAVFSVGSSSLAALHNGQQIAVSVQGLPRPITGIVTSLPPAADPKTRVFDVEVTIPNPHQELRPGMTGDLQLGSADSKRAELTTSLSALVSAPSGQGAFAVYTLDGASDNATVHLVPITVGEVRGDRVIVRQGLAAGQRVITSGATLLHDGQHVRVTP